MFYVGKESDKPTKLFARKLVAGTVLEAVALAESMKLLHGYNFKVLTVVEVYSTSKED
jgi:hypothetical protein